MTAIVVWSVILALTLAAFITLFVVLWRTREKAGTHRRDKLERRRLRTAAGWVALALTYASDAGSWAREKIRDRIRRLGASPSRIPPAENPDPARSITATHMNAIRRVGGERPWEYETGEWPKIMLPGGEQ